MSGGSSRGDAWKAPASGGQFDRFYLVLRDRYRRRDDWARAYGPFIADLVTGGDGAAGDFRLLRRLHDGYVFEVVRRP